MCSWKVIGISGVTCSGKTTISRFIENHFQGSMVVLQDNFFRDEHSRCHTIIPELNHANWECLGAIDWDLLMDTVGEILGTSPSHPDSLLIIEGHIIYNYEPLESLFDAKYFLTLTREECLRRRKARVYDPPDPPGYFDLCVWPMYRSNKEHVDRNCQNVRIVDGSRPVSDICHQIIEELKAS